MPKGNFRNYQNIVLKRKRKKGIEWESIFVEHGIPE